MIPKNRVGSSSIVKCGIQCLQNICKDCNAIYYLNINAKAKVIKFKS